MIILQGQKTSAVFSFPNYGIVTRLRTLHFVAPSALPFSFSPTGPAFPQLPTLAAINQLGLLKSAACSGESSTSTGQQERKKRGKKAETKREGVPKEGWIFGKYPEGGGRLIERLKRPNHVGGVGLRRGAFLASLVEGEKCKCVYS